VDPEKRRALSSFYREEFLRYLEHFESAGIGGRHVCRKLITDIDDVCCRPRFPALAETLLQNFDALAHLSQLDPRQRH
jgi:hypothetical protein